MKNLNSWLKKTLLTGLILVLPLAVSLWIVYLIFKKVDGIFRPIMDKLLGYHIPGLGFILTFILILIAGIIGANIIGKRLFAKFDNFMLRIPLIRILYKTTKQIIDAARLKEKFPFKQVGIVEYPRKGMFALGFLLSEIKGEVKEKTSQDLICFFIPTTPNPTSGMLIFVPEKDIIPVDMKIEEALKIIISAGIVRRNS